MRARANSPIARESSRYGAYGGGGGGGDGGGWAVTDTRTSSWNQHAGGSPHWANRNLASSVNAAGGSPNAYGQLQIPHAEVNMFAC